MNSTPHTSQFSRHLHALILMSHGHWLNFGVRSAHLTSSHASSSSAHVVCFILRDSPFLFLQSIFSPVVPFTSWLSASSSTMWRTNTLCTLANEDFGTPAECDPLTSAVLLQSGLEKNGGQIPCKAVPICEKTFKISFLMGRKTPCERRFGEPFRGLIVSFGSLVE